MGKINAGKTIEFLNTRWNGAACPLCGGTEWTVTDKSFELREFNNGNLVLGGAKSSIVPVIPVTCSKCGNTVFINAIVANLLEE